MASSEAPRSSDPRDDDSPVAHEQLRQLLDELDAARAEARELADGLDARRLWWRPGPDRWSVGECLDHLVRTGEAYLPAFDRALARAEEKGRTADGPFSRGFLGRWLVRGMEPPPRLRVPSPEAFLPRRDAAATERRAPGGSAPDEAGAGDDGPGHPGGSGLEDPPAGDTGRPLPRFLSLQDRVARRIVRADGLDLEAVRVPSPVLSFLSLNLYAALAYLSAHQRRHLWQARQVTEADGWPPGL